jgi:hypothetical protein
MPGPLVRALIAQVDGSFAGPNGDYPAVLEAIAGLTAQQALWRPAPGGNSIWQITEFWSAALDGKPGDWDRLFKSYASSVE